MNRNNATNAHANVQRNDNIRTVFVSAVILTVAGIIVKALGFLFRVPLTNLLGDRGMAYYAPAYDIYTFLLIISTSGIPVAISRMVAERCAVCDFMGARRVIIVSRRIAVLLGMIGFLILFFWSRPYCKTYSQYSKFSVCNENHCTCTFTGSGNVCIPRIFSGTSANVAFSNFRNCRAIF